MHILASHGRTKRLMAWLAVALLAFSYFITSLNSIPVQAAEVTTRSIDMASSEEDAETSYAIQFTVPAGSVIGAVRIEFCDNDPLPHTTCTNAGVGDDIPQVDDNAGTVATEAGGGGAFAFTGATATECDAPDLATVTDGDRHLDILCDSPDTFAGTTTFTGTVNFIDNPSNATDSPANPNNTFYARIYIYNTITPGAIGNPVSATNVIHTGGIAMSTAEQLTVTARVQEVLEFCVGTQAGGAAAPANCAAQSGNAINLGVLDFNTVYFASSPGGTNNQGSILVRTNASNGVVIDYFAEQAGTGTNHLGALRVTGASCNAGVVTTDQCINSVGTTQDVITAGVEEFGICTLYDNSSSNAPNTTNNLTRDTNYDGACDNTATNGFAFDETGATDTLASSTTVVNEEALAIEFAGTSSVTTPTGVYNVTLTFIGTATF